MRGQYFYFFIGLCTASLAGHVLKAGVLGTIAIGIVNVLAIAFWFYILRTWQTGGLDRSLCGAFLLMSPVCYILGVTGGLVLFAR